MSAPQSDSILPGVLIVLVLLPVFYGIGRAGNALGNVRSAYLLAPLAPIIGGHVERSRRRIVGTYEGSPVRRTGSSSSTSPERSGRAGVSSVSEWPTRRYASVSSRRA
jgi:hypothetical protein